MTTKICLYKVNIDGNGYRKTHNVCKMRASSIIQNPCSQILPCSNFRPINI